MTALVLGSESEIDSANAENEANGCPLRESIWVQPCSITASALKPWIIRGNRSDDFSLFAYLSACLL